jgi:hypothetical protein
LHDSFTFAWAGGGSIGADGVWAGLLCVEVSSEGDSTAWAVNSSAAQRSITISCQAMPPWSDSEGLT